MTNGERIKFELLVLEAHIVAAIYFFLSNICLKIGDKHHKIAKKVFEITGKYEVEE